jgi:polysaccharide export outer membrane protein
MTHTSLTTSFTLRLAAAAVAATVLLPRGLSAADPPLRPDTSPIVGEYKLGAGDKLRIEVYKDAQLSQSVQIRPDGKITLPLVGDIEATERTPLELRDQITKLLREYMTNPVVTVIVVEAISAQVFVTGEVSKSGPVPVHGPLNILQAIAMAGGFNEWANKKDIRILRQGPTGVQTLHFNYLNAIDGEVRPLYLKAGDTVIVR